MTSRVSAAAGGHWPCPWKPPKEQWLLCAMPSFVPLPDTKELFHTEPCPDKSSTSFPGRGDPRSPRSSVPSQLCECRAGPDVSVIQGQSQPQPGEGAWRVWSSLWLGKGAWAGAGVGRAQQRLQAGAACSGVDGAASLQAQQKGPCAHAPTSPFAITAQSGRASRCQAGLWVTAPSCQPC